MFKSNISFAEKQLSSYLPKAGKYNEKETIVKIDLITKLHHYYHLLLDTELFQKKMF